MDYQIGEIEGIGPVNKEKLVSAGITTTGQLLEKCGTKTGRVSAAEATGLTTSQLLKFANMADLMRVNGIGKQFAELLKATGVDTIKELRQRRADNLSSKMAEINAAKNLARSVPTEDQVAGWIEAAKEMEPAITY